MVQELTIMKPDPEVGFYEQRLLLFVVIAITAFVLAVVNGDVAGPLDGLRRALEAAGR